MKPPPPNILDERGRRVQRVQATPSPPSLIVFLLNLHGDFATYFHAASPSFFHARVSSRPAVLEPGRLYALTASSTDPGEVHFSELPVFAKRNYTRPGELAFTRDAYASIVLRARMLEARLLDYEESCARVLQRCPLLISIPNIDEVPEEAHFRSESGEDFSVVVNEVSRGITRTKMFCTTDFLPDSVTAGSRLERQDYNYNSYSTRGLEAFYRGHRPITSAHSKFFDRIYGAAHAFTFPPVDTTLLKIPMIDGSEVTLNGNISEICQRHCSDVPGLAIEVLRDSEYLVADLAAAMAASFNDGRQLFLAPDNEAGCKVAAAFEDVDFGARKIIHLINPDREAAMLSWGRRTVFSPLSGAANTDNPSIRRFNALRDAARGDGWRMWTSLLPQMRKEHQTVWRSLHEDYDVIICSLPTALSLLLDPESPPHLKLLLQKRISKIVCVEAHHLSEVDLNAIVLNFIHHESGSTSLSLIGTPKRMSPSSIINYYTVKKPPGDLVGCSALEAFTRKGNVPCIKLRNPYNLPSQVYEPYLEGEMPSNEDEDEEERVVPAPPRPTLTTISTGFMNSLETDVKEDGALGLLRKVLKQQGGFEGRRGTVFSYFEEPWSAGDAKIGRNYQLIRMEDVMGQEVAIIIVLTARDAPHATTVFFSYTTQFNEAEALHKDVIAKLRDDPLIQAAPWQQLLQNKFYAGRSSLMRGLGQPDRLALESNEGRNEG